VNDRQGNWDEFALLLIDVQNDFWVEPMSLARPQFEANVARLLDLCRTEGIDVVHVRARFRDDRSDWMPRYRLTGRIPCIEGTPGVATLPAAADEAGEFVIYKQSFDAFLKPALPAWLEKNGKRFVLVAGLVTSVCVLLTAAAAAQRGYLVGVVEDCCADQPAAHGHTLDRYPFVFDRTTIDGLAGRRAQWLADLESVSG